MKRKRINWPELYEEFSQSKLSVNDFCAAKGVSPSSFYKNKSRSKRKSETHKTLSKKIELYDLSSKLQLEAPTHNSPTIRLNSPSGMVLEVYL